jgi:hypothetical protein
VLTAAVDDRMYGVMFRLISQPSNGPLPYALSAGGLRARCPLGAGTRHQRSGCRHFGCEAHGRRLHVEDAVDIGGEQRIDGVGIACEAVLKGERRLWVQ